MGKNKKRTGFLALCTLPAAILFVIFMIVPTIQVFAMSLFKWGGYSSTKTFVGFENFNKLFADPKFIQSCQNTILLVVLVTIVTFSFSLIFAGILSRDKIKGQNFFRIIFYIPNILSVVVIAAIFNAIYDPNNGLLNSFLNLFTNLKDDPILWLGDHGLVIFSLAGALVWQAIGYYMVMYMASMSSLPESVYESADLEGASRFT
ncbi:MAG: sugar ABC transporter permease, partial [Oscillospiraceae bacterium]